MPSSVKDMLAPIASPLRTDRTVDELLARIRSYTALDEWDEIERLIGEAAAFAQRAHSGQQRLTGEPFFQHPLTVAWLLADLRLDSVTITAALLHDCIEDTSADLHTIRERFGSTVAELVDGVTKLDEITSGNIDDRQAQNLRKIFRAMARDIRVVLIKLADRLHNIQTASVYSEEKGAQYATDTMEIFAPLAGRLGIEEWRWQLEDHAFRTLHPERYQEIAQWLVVEQQARETVMHGVTDELRKGLDDCDLDALIQSRVKHIYSIEQKARRKAVPLDQVYDILAVRVVVEDVADCYAALGVVHATWRHIPEQFDDYISAPKENAYRSIHTAVMGPDGKPIEIQIRTYEMHESSEYGVAAHWRYKADDQGSADAFSEKLGWIRQILAWEGDEEPDGSFIEAVKSDVFGDAVFVFTPTGEIKDFPSGSTPLDFSYRIHTDIGHACIGAKINGRLVQLDHRLENGDVVEILTSQNSPGPSRSWVSMVHTAYARDKIRQWFKRRERTENIQSGMGLLGDQLRRLGHEHISHLASDDLADIAKSLGYDDVDSLFAGIGYGATTVTTVINRIELVPDVLERDLADQELEGPGNTDRHGENRPIVQVLGAGNLTTRVASCCNPTPGDDIVGYISSGHDVSVHQLSCSRWRTVEPERLVDVKWSAKIVESDTDFPIRLASCCAPRPPIPIVGILITNEVEVHTNSCCDVSHGADEQIDVWWIDDTSTILPIQIRIVADDRAGLTHDVSGVIRDEGLNISSAHINTNQERRATMRVTVGLVSMGQLARLMSRLETIPGVFDVARDGVHRRNRS